MIGTFRGLPPLRPFSREAADFASLLVLPPILPNSRASILSDRNCQGLAFDPLPPQAGHGRGMPGTSTPNPEQAGHSSPGEIPRASIQSRLSDFLTGSSTASRSRAFCMFALCLFVAVIVNLTDLVPGCNRIRRWVAGLLIPALCTGLLSRSRMEGSWGVGGGYSCAVVEFLALLLRLITDVPQHCLGVRAPHAERHW